MKTEGGINQLQADQLGITLPETSSAHIMTKIILTDNKAHYSENMHHGNHTLEGGGHPYSEADKVIAIPEE